MRRPTRRDRGPDGAVVEACEPRVLLSTYLVTNTNDAGPGSLRQAILDSNGAPGADGLSFSIPAAGPQVIAPLTPLPAVTDALLIDGYSQPGSMQNNAAVGDDAVPRIVLSGANLGNSTVPGLQLNADSCTVDGLVVQAFGPAAGIQLNGGGGHVFGNFIGTDPSGSAAAGNSVGIDVESAGNVVGNSSDAPDPTSANLISGNGTGVSVGRSFADAGNNRIAQNLIGTGASGAAALGNGIGIDLRGGIGNFVGGMSMAVANTISGNAAAGLQIGGGTAAQISNNRIGASATGGTAVPNGQQGILAAGGTLATIVGNQISGNVSDGLVIAAASDSNTVINNLIGTDASGAAPLGNGGAGVRIASSHNTIGPRPAVVGSVSNVIAYNRGGGILVTAGAGNTLSANSIFSNTGGLGIDLGGDGPTANDSKDADTGPNNLQNAPVLTAVSNTATATIISGTINSTPNRILRIEFFDSPAADPGGYGQGQDYVLSLTVTTDANGNATFSGVTLPLVPRGVITATATDNTTGDTSEFSRALPLSPNSPGDANGDGVVNFSDLLILAQHYGNTAGMTPAAGDFTGDGAVTFADLLVLAQNYGRSATRTRLRKTN